MSNEPRSTQGQGGRRGGRGGFSSPQKQPPQQQRVPESNGASAAPKPLPAETKGKETVDGEEEAEVCFICASEVVHHSVPPCNHRTCHICSLRMRALYKTNDCPHCRVSYCSPSINRYILIENRHQRRWLYSQTMLRNSMKTSKNPISPARTRISASDTRIMISWKIPSYSSATIARLLTAMSRV